MKRPGNEIKRIPLLFFLGIGIPCLLLGYLAFRGIRNDQALLDKERLNDQRKILELVTGSVAEQISETEQAFFPVLTRDLEVNQHHVVHSLDSLKNLYPLADEIFISDSTGKIRFPMARLLFLTDGEHRTFGASSRTPVQLGKVQTAQQLEFREKKFDQALALYRDEFNHSVDPAIKGEMLFSIARIQKKSMLFRDAIKTWENVGRDFKQLQTAGGVPLGLAARLEISSLSLATGDTAAAFKAFLELYDDLINGEWTLEKAQYDFFSHQIREPVDGMLSRVNLAESLHPYNSTFQLLKTGEDERRKVTERLLSFRNNSGADLKAKSLQNPEGISGQKRRFILESGEYAYLVSVLVQSPGNTGLMNEIRGFLLSEEYLRDSLLRKALQKNIPEKTSWIVKGRDDEIILKSGSTSFGSIAVSTNFEGGFPPWTIDIFQPEPDLFKTFLFSHRGIYFFVFLLLAGILAFGLILTIRTVTRQLELSKMKSDFVSTVSHEFKSPLSSIRQLAELLQSGRITSEDRRRQYYDVLVEQSERLTLLIDNILDFAKIEEGRKKFEIEVTDMGTLLQDTVTTIQDQVRHKDFMIQLETDKPLPEIRADKAAIVQTITNLIDNAVKYSGESRKIIVRAFTENQTLVLSVKDFGIGIKKEEIDKIFERFYRGGDELTRNVKGSGLGLTLAKHIVEAHRGTIEVESEPGKGSIFTLRIPLG